MHEKIVSGQRGPALEVSLEVWCADRQVAYMSSLIELGDLFVDRTGYYANAFW